MVSGASSIFHRQGRGMTGELLAWTLMGVCFLGLVALILARV